MGTTIHKLYQNDRIEWQNLYINSIVDKNAGYFATPSQMQEILKNAYSAGWIDAEEFHSLAIERHSSPFQL